MKKRSYLPAKLIVFVCGIAALVVAFVLLNPIFENLKLKDQFIFSSVCVSTLYLVIFLPILVSAIDVMNVAVPVSGAVYFKAIATYSVVTVASIVIAFLRLPLAIAIVVQCVGFFVSLIWILAAVFTKDQIEAVQRNEDVKKSAIVDLRTKSASLFAMAQGVNDNALRNEIKKINENMEYLSPSDSVQAQELERGMVALMNAMLSDGFFMGTGDKNALETKLRDFDALYRQRKTIY